MENPNISVIIPLYNHEKFIREAIISVLDQTVSDFEIIVINDGSTDHSEDEVLSIQDDRIVYLSQKNQGASQTINRGIALAKGEFVSVLNSDDMYHPDRFEKCLQIMETDHDIAAVFSHVELIDESGKSTGVKQGAADNWNGHHPDTSFKEHHEIVLDLLAGNFLVSTSNLMCRRSVFEKLGGFRNLKYTHDYDFFLRLGYEFSTRLIDVPLLKYRIHSNNTIQSQNPEVSFEVGFVISDFLIHHDLCRYWKDMNPLSAMTRLYNSLNTYKADREILVLVLMGLKYETGIADHISKGDENAFKSICIHDLNEEIEQYRSVQEIYAQWTDTNDRLADANDRLAGAYEEVNRYYRESQKAWAAWKDVQERLTDAEQSRFQAQKEILDHIEQRRITDEKMLNVQLACHQVCESQKAFEQSLNEILGSRTYKLAGLFRDAMLSRNGLLVLPLRLIWFGLPSSMQSLLNPVVDCFKFRLIAANSASLHIRNKRWPSGKPLVSVVIPCYNYGRFLEDAVDSVVAQTFPEIEIIVVNDGSNDPQTIALLDNLNKPKTRVVHQRNLKLPAARNRGIREARGKYICCLDADDTLAATYIEKCVYRMETEGLDICGCLQQNFGNDTAVIDPGGFTLAALLESNHMINAAVFRKSLWKTIGGYDVNFSSGYEDWEFWIRMAAHGARAGIVPEPLFEYRKHGRSMIDETLEKHPDIVAEIHRKHAKRLKRVDPPRGCVVHDRFVNLAARSGNAPNNANTLLVAMPFLTLGGAEKVMSRMVSHLAEKGYRIILITTQPPLPEMGDTTSWFDGATSEIYHLPRFLNEPDWKDFVFYLIATRRIHVAWVVGSTFFYELLPAIKSYFPKICVVDLLFNTVGHTASNRKYNYLIDLIFTENREVDRWLIEHGEVSDRLVNSVSGVDITAFSPLSQKSENVINRIGRDKETVVGFCGRFSEEKGPDIFLEIVGRLKAHAAIGFIMTGGGPLVQESMNRIDSMGLGDRIHYFGMVQDVRPYLGSCDALVVPSRLDGRPTAVLQALAMGVPVVASRVGALPEIIHDGENGFLCQVAQVDEFVSYIQMIASDSRLRENLGKNARRYAETHLDETQWLKTIESVLSDLIHAHRG